MAGCCVVVASPRTASRTRACAEQFARGCFEGSVTVVELGDPAGAAAAAEAVRRSDMVVLASPTYQGTYTGLLKTFVETAPPGFLEGKPAVGLMTGGDSRHSRTGPLGLTQLLVDLGAIPIAPGVFVVVSDAVDAEEQVTASVRVLVHAVSSISALRVREPAAAAEPPGQNRG